MPVNVEQALKQAKRHIKKGDMAAAEEAYRAILQAFPRNKRAKDGLTALQGQGAVEAAPPPDKVRELINLFTAGKLEDALAQGAALIAAYPRAALLYNIAGAANAGLRRYDEALKNYRQALAIDPSYAEAHNNLGGALKDKGDFTAAIESYRAAIRLKPEYAEAYNNLGAALQASGDLAGAVDNFRQALRLKPDHVEALGNMSTALKDQGKLDEALAGYKKLVSLRPDLASAHNGIGAVLKAQGDLQGAIPHFKRAISLDPSHAGGYISMGNALQVQGDFAGATENFKHALKLEPDNIGAHRNLGLIKKYKTGDAQIAQMRKLAARENLSLPDKIFISFALGKAYADTGETDEAFKWISQGNRLRKRELKYDIATDRQLFARIRKSFAETPLRVTPEKEAVQKPVFIVGMPRSGTSLVEQILDSHSAVHGAGELQLAVDSLKKAGWPPQPFEDGYLARFRADYLAGLSALGVSGTFITDKMPLNFRWVGYILCAMPEAIVIHTTRDARATCWSVFRHYFSSRGNGYAYDLSDVAAYYRMYAELMDFWHEKFPGRIYDLSYEALTQNQEEEIRKLLAHAGLGWEGACLEFHKNARAVLTTSSAQVRQKMYQGSSEEWRKYEAHLGPLLAGLEGL